MAENLRKTNLILDKNLAFDMVRATEYAAIAAFGWLGLGDENAADHAAVEAMRKSLNQIDIDGIVVIGEGERDEAPMLYIGEKVGTGKGYEVDIALDPLEGTTILATGNSDSLSVLAMTEKGKFLNAPDTYMDKIAVGLKLDEQIIDLDNSVKENLSNISKASKKPIEELLVVILNRPRHEELIARVRESGARVKLIGDGDVAAVIATSNPDSLVDVYMGQGGAPEGVLAASALCTTGGQMCTRLIIRNDNEAERAKKMGITDFSKKYYLNDLASGDVLFAATGVTDGGILSGVKKVENFYHTHSIVMRAATSEVRFISSKIMAL